MERIEKMARNRNPKKCVAVAKVRKLDQKGKVFSGELTGTLQVYLYPPNVPGKTWGLGVGPKGETPRIVTPLKETRKGVLEGEGNSPWKALQVRDNSTQKEWEIFFTASKA